MSVGRVPVRHPFYTPPRTHLTAREPSTLSLKSYNRWVEDFCTTHTQNGNLNHTTHTQSTSGIGASSHPSSSQPTVNMTCANPASSATPTTDFTWQCAWYQTSHTSSTAPNWRARHGLTYQHSKTTQPIGLTPVGARSTRVSVAPLQRPRTPLTVQVMQSGIVMPPRYA